MRSQGGGSQRAVAGAAPGDSLTAVSRGLVAIAVIVSDRHVLVGRRADNTPPWTFLGSKVEPGETAEAAAVREEREEREEAQLAIVALHTLGRRIHPVTGRELVYVAAVAAGARPALAALDPALTEVRWATLDELDQLLPNVFAPARHWLTQCLG